MNSNQPVPKGRGTPLRPTNRFERVALLDDWEQLASDDDQFTSPAKIATEYLVDNSRSIIAKNDSPDIPFRFSVNPYRGCEHGCAYCYARPGHELLGWNAGLDFETKILAKLDAAKLLRRELNRPSWQADLIALSGVTDCYQPVERKLKITRACLEVFLEARQPIAIVTKNALVVRDIDLLAEMAQRKLVHVMISVTTLDAELARSLEPRTSTPAARLDAIAQLSKSGIPTGVMVAPIIPALNDEEIPAILEAVAKAGARSAGKVLLRLPYAVASIFEDWLTQYVPLKKERILARVRGARGGKLNDSRFGSRMQGAGAYAQQIDQTFRVFKKKHGLDGQLPELDRSQFRRPTDASGQQWLFD